MNNSGIPSNLRVCFSVSSTIVKSVMAHIGRRLIALVSSILKVLRGTQFEMDFRTIIIIFKIDFLP